MNTIQNAKILKGTKVLIRLDLDVPIQNGKPSETYRLQAGLKSLKYIIDKGAMPIIIGHMGKPKGMVVPELSTTQLIDFYNKHLGKDNFILKENLRFNSGEQDNSDDFAKELAKEADIFVNDSFATCHREHASIVGIPKYLNSYAGFNLQQEIEELKKVKHNFNRPFVVIIGGAKLESKMPVINAFLKVADSVLLGSKIGPQWIEQQKDIPSNLILPKDYAQDKKDIGPLTIKNFTNIISLSKTVLWAGPMGFYEDPNYLEGTKKIAQAITDNPDIWSVIGGGDTITAVNMCNLQNDFGFVSTGGSAMLIFLVQDTLPGIEVLK